jgi:protein TonB
MTTTTTTVPPSPEAAPNQARTNIPPVIVEPRCESCPPPAYPRAPEKYGSEGRVELEITVDAKGNVTATRVVSGDKTFSAAAQKAVRRWRFAPATSDDVPIAFTLKKMVVFTQNPPR